MPEAHPQVMAITKVSKQNQKALRGQKKKEKKKITHLSPPPIENNHTRFWTSGCLLKYAIKKKVKINKQAKMLWKTLGPNQLLFASQGKS